MQVRYVYYRSSIVDAYTYTYMERCGIALRTFEHVQRIRYINITSDSIHTVGL